MTVAGLGDRTLASTRAGGGLGGHKPEEGLAAWGTKDLSYDATSPIKDAVEGSLYVSKPAYLKIRIRSIAWRLASV